MKETKKLQVLPSEEEYTVNAYASFGWELTSSQEIKTSDSHMERRGDSIYNVTEKENYVNIIISRDTAIPNYAKLCGFQKEFENAKAARQSRIGVHGLVQLFAVLLIFPMVIIVVKNKKIDAHNDEMHNTMQQAIKKARDLQVAATAQ